MEPKIDIHNRAAGPRIKGISSWRIPEVEKSELIRFLELLELGRVNKGVRISQSRLCKYMDVLKTPLEFFGKVVTEVKVEDVESFERGFNNGTIHTRRGTLYAPNTRVDIRRALKTYLRWRLGRQAASDLVDWLDTRQAKKTPDYLKEVEVEQLFKHCKSSRERFLIAVLFDAGARAGEFHNIRFEDIQLPQGDRNYVKINLKEEYSKTKGRNVSLFWRRSTEAVVDYVEERQKQGGIRPGDPVFEMNYVASRAFLHRLGKKILGRSIYFHLFRHSSATYYADKMNRQQLCIRYGWTFSSDMPDIYISRAGVESMELDSKRHA